MVDMHHYILGVQLRLNQEVDAQPVSMLAVSRVGRVGQNHDTVQRELMMVGFQPVYDLKGVQAGQVKVEQGDIRSRRYYLVTRNSAAYNSQNLEAGAFELG